MSKKTQVLKNLTLADLCNYSIDTSPRNLASVNEASKTMDYIIEPKQFRSLSGSLFIIKSEKKVANNVLVGSVKIKNIKKVVQFLSYNTGLEFVSLIAYYKLNTSIISL